MIDEYIESANLRFSEMQDAQEEARRLYVAHKLTIWAQSFSGISSDPQQASLSQLASAGMAAQTLSKSVGGVSVSKSEGSAVNSVSGYAEWKQTTFGMQLISLCKIATAGGYYVP